jgi:hypothetical protein
MIINENFIVHTLLPALDHGGTFVFAPSGATEGANTDSIGTLSFAAGNSRPPN